MSTYQLSEASLENLETKFYKATEGVSSADSCKSNGNDTEDYDDDDDDERTYNLLAACEGIIHITESEGADKPFFTTKKFINTAVRALNRATSSIVVGNLAHLLRNLITYKTARSAKCGLAKKLMSTGEFVDAINNGYRVCLEESKVRFVPSSSSSSFSSPSLPSAAASFSAGEMIRWLNSALCCVTTQPNPYLARARALFTTEETLNSLLQNLVAIKNGIILYDKTGKFEKEKRELMTMMELGNSNRRQSDIIPVLRITADGLRWLLCTFCNLLHRDNPQHRLFAKMLLLQEEEKTENNNNNNNNNSSNRANFLETFCFIITNFSRHSPESIQWSLALIANATHEFSLATVRPAASSDPITDCFRNRMFLNTFSTFSNVVDSDEGCYWMLTLMSRLATHQKSVIFPVSDYLKCDSKFMEGYIRLKEKYSSAKFTSSVLRTLDSQLLLESMLKKESEQRSPF